MEKEFKKVVRDGKVAVVIAEKHGAGWYSAHGRKELLFHPKIVELVESGRNEEITLGLCRELLGTDDYINAFGAGDLVVEWIEEGEEFVIFDYDGYERIIMFKDFTLKA